ncbi:MAG: nucleotidyltransferase domain-containing protein [Deltaproteobacteria bacterium]|nr:nucleotidyltransferase domain-containing protein [Deltaproteobacteria bacterium]
MSKNIDHGLTIRQVKTIRQILSLYADEINSVSLFGSRAQGKYRPNSDIDLVIRGDLSEKTGDRLWTLFFESNLVLKVDILLYDKIKKPALKEHINLVELPLFTHKELECFQEKYEEIS